MKTCVRIFTKDTQLQIFKLLGNWILHTFLKLETAETHTNSRYWVILSADCSSSMCQVLCYCNYTSIINCKRDVLEDLWNCAFYCINCGWNTGVVNSYRPDKQCCATVSSGDQSQCWILCLLCVSSVLTLLDLPWPVCDSCQISVCIKV